MSPPTLASRECRTYTDVMSEEQSYRSSRNVNPGTTEDLCDRGGVSLYLSPPGLPPHSHRLPPVQGGEWRQVRSPGFVDYSPSTGRTGPGRVLLSTRTPLGLGTRPTRPRGLRRSWRVSPDGRSSRLGDSVGSEVFRRTGSKIRSMCPYPEPESSSGFRRPGEDWNRYFCSYERISGGVGVEWGKTTVQTRLGTPFPRALSARSPSWTARDRSRVPLPGVVRETRGQSRGGSLSFRRVPLPRPPNVMV